VEIRIDQELCQGHLQCVFLAPELFAEGDDGRARVRCDLVPAKLAEAAREAATNCPEQAIRVRETGP